MVLNGTNILNFYAKNMEEAKKKALKEANQEEEIIIREYKTINGVNYCY